MEYAMRISFSVGVKFIAHVYFMLLIQRIKITTFWNGTIKVT